MNHLSDIWQNVDRTNQSDVRHVLATTTTAGIKIKSWKGQRGMGDETLLHAMEGGEGVLCPAEDIDIVVTCWDPSW